MDDSATTSAKKPTEQPPLGMSSFNRKEQQQFGQNMLLAMACIEGKAQPVSAKAIPDNADEIRHRLKALSQDINSSHADLLELLVRFDELEGWKTGGASHCAAWVNLEIGISLKLGWEYLRVGRKLRQLSTTRALFRAGKLSWSKVRLIASVANGENENTLCHAALDGSVSEVKRLCSEYRWQENEDKDGREENDRAIKQWRSRSFTWQETAIGSTHIQLTLPPEVAQAFLNSVEQSLNLLENCNVSDQNISDKIEDSTISQRRADAAVLMAENALQNSGREIATADRYQVIVSVDAEDMSTSTRSESTAESTATSPPTLKTPTKRPTVKHAGPIARETARRISCDCSISTNITSNGEPINIGRKSRIWPNPMSRAIIARDKHCQFPGCTRTHHLKIHHIIHWADGGETSIENGVCLCQSHHTLVHEGGYTIERVTDNERRMQEQFKQQRHTKDISQFDFEKDLRNDKWSFDRVRMLSPTRYRFRVMNAQGVDIRTITDIAAGADPVVKDAQDAGNSQHTYQSGHPTKHSTRIVCSEPEPEVYAHNSSSFSSHYSHTIAHYRALPQAQFGFRI